LVFPVVLPKYRVQDEDEKGIGRHPIIGFAIDVELYVFVRVKDIEIGRDRYR